MKTEVLTLRERVPLDQRANIMASEVYDNFRNYFIGRREDVVTHFIIGTEESRVKNDYEWLHNRALGIFCEKINIPNEVFMDEVGDSFHVPFFGRVITNVANWTDMPTATGVLSVPTHVVMHGLRD